MAEKISLMKGDRVKILPQYAYMFKRGAAVGTVRSNEASRKDGCVMVKWDQYITPQVINRTFVEKIDG